MDWNFTIEFFIGALIACGYTGFGLLVFIFATKQQYAKSIACGLMGLALLSLFMGLIR